jgi:hypothetical protein
MPAGQQVAFQPALQCVLAEHLHDPTVGRQLTTIGILREIFAEPGLFGHLIERGQAVGGVLVRTEYPEVVRVVARDITQELA